MNERSWLIPSAVLTVGMGATALAIMPNYSVVMPALKMLPLWLISSAVLACVFGFAGMMVARVPDPLAFIRRSMIEQWRHLLVMAVGIGLAGLNMITFMWSKPLLNYFLPFRADPVLAAFDRALFLGRDPWTLFDWLNTMPMAIFYHRGWFALMIVTLLVVVSRRASQHKSALMLTYFLLWTIVGPLIHVLLPAAGPVFAARLGYGNAFAAIPLPEEMVRMTDYLWDCYTGARFGAGSGISAMPSLHIATTAWMVIAIRAVAPRWTWAVALPGALIFLLSISLGWHYAVDGIVGAAAALGCYRASLRYFASRSTSPEHLIAEPAPASL